MSLSDWRICPHDNDGISVWKCTTRPDYIRIHRDENGGFNVVMLNKDRECGASIAIGVDDLDKARHKSVKYRMNYGMGFWEASLD